ncbi:hypothetical protein AX14_003956 [Amanita brunnescens Koide BX004]|nr:hypothetical protein AX14_003956 [Amanita brunnescens Koide BX004]
MATSKECPFYLGRMSKERHAELYAKIEAKFPKKNQKDAQAGLTRKSGGRKKVGFSNPDAEGFIQVGVTPGIARIDAVPSEPQPPASVKPLGGSIVGTIADEALHPELKGNEEARRLMQETLLDEAAFAAADAAAKPTDSLDHISKTRFAFQNVHKSRLTVHELLENLKNNIDFLFVQENPFTFIRNVPSSSNEVGDPLIGPVHHRQWQCVEKTSIQASSQVAIYVNKCLLENFQIFPNFSTGIDPNVLPVTLKHNIIGSCSFTIVNVYNPPKTRNSAVRALIDLLPHLPDALVVQGDFNLPSGIWDPNCNNSSPLSIELFNRLSDEDFGLCNDEGAPTWTNRRGAFSVLDLKAVVVQTTLFFPSPSAQQNIGVDHISPRRINASADNDTESLVTSIGDDILDSWNRNSKTPRIGSSSVTWWTADCQHAKDEYLASRTRDNQRAYDATTKKARADFFNRKIDLMTANAMGRR